MVKFRRLFKWLKNQPQRREGAKEGLKVRFVVLPSFVFSRSYCFPLRLRAFAAKI